MTQYIDKDALVVKIERWIELLTNEKNQEGASLIDKLSLGGRIAELQEVKVFIDTLEVKEVDLDGERRKYLTEHFNVYEDGILQSKRSNLPLDTYDVIKIAKHFLELGLKAQKGEGV